MERIGNLFPMDEAAKLVSAKVAEVGSMVSSAWMTELAQETAASVMGAMQILPDSGLWHASTLGAIGDYVANRFAMEDADTLLPVSWGPDARASALASRPSADLVAGAFEALKEDISDTLVKGLRVATDLTATVERLGRSSPSRRIWMLVAILGLILMAAGDVAGYLALLRH
jgi:hypothetical protein